MHCEIIDCYFNTFFVETQLKKKTWNVFSRCQSLGTQTSIPVSQTAWIRHRHIINITFLKVKSYGIISSVSIKILVSNFPIFIISFILSNTLCNIEPSIMKYFSFHFYQLAVNISNKINHQIPIVFLID